MRHILKVLDAPNQNFSSFFCSMGIFVFEKIM